MIPKISKELKDLFSRYQKQFPDKVADLTFNQTIFIVIKIYKNLMQMQPDTSDVEAVRIIRRTFFSKISFSNLMKED